MTVYAEKAEDGKQKLYDQGEEIKQKDWDAIKGKTIKNIQKLDGKILFTLK